MAAVNDAAKVGMTVLKNGGAATDAVEMAIRLLEDKEITNAGFGSNLTMEGQVECDATVVDHIGRSGAVGAISLVRNPIAVARLVLEDFTKPLSLQRVPPNLLVGAGATDYAAGKGIPILPPDFLVAEGARDRWLKWRRDLEDARQKEAEAKAEAEAQTQARGATSRPSFSPMTPSTSNPTHGVRPSLAALPAIIRPLLASTADVPTLGRVADDRNNSFPLTRPGTNGAAHEHTTDEDESSDQHEAATDDSLPWIMSPAKRQRLNGSFDGPLSDGGDDSVDMKEYASPDTPAGCGGMEERGDEITDTVGAIAVDCFGHIAAGSSSGGIGMKHKGRCGPAALIGVGTAVIPIDPQDPTQACVATVASGTGEHMATTTAAAVAAERIYNSVRKEKGKIMSCNEDEAMHSVIEQDFMTHPAVSSSHCTGAIGILAVKKTLEGIYFYFGHNSDSFALASMHSEERQPVCTMSRSEGDGKIAQGGRVSRAKHGRLH